MRPIFRKVALLPYMFVLMNCAVVAGLFQFVRGADGIWEPDGLRRRLG